MAHTQKRSVNDLYKKKPSMAAPKKEKGARKLLKEARSRARFGSDKWGDNWIAWEDNLKFLGGDQWPADVLAEREEDGRPCLTNNVLPSFVDRVLGEQRKNKTQIKINATQSILVPKAANDEDGNPVEADPNGQIEYEPLKIPNMTGKKQYEVAQVLQGLIKNIEYNCDAEDAYDLAYQGAVQSGMGYLRVRNDYLDDSFEQDLIIECLENQFSVVMDPMSKKPDTSDKNWCLVDEMMDKDEFYEKYPDASPEPVTMNDSNNMAVWYTEKTVRVSEYYTRKQVMKEKVLLTDGREMYMDEIEKIVDELAEKGIFIKRTRKVKTYEVFWRKITGQDILEGPIKLNCSIIPVIPIMGKKLKIKERDYYYALIENSKDAMRMANYWDSAATEAVALAPKAPFIGTAEHIEGYEEEWEHANRKNYGVLIYNAQDGNPQDRGPTRSQPTSIPAAEITLAQSSTDKIKSTMGMFDASLGAQGNETSGKAINARINQADAGSYTFQDNFYKALRMVGRILIEMIPKIYDTDRQLRIKFPDDTEDFVKINELVLDKQSGEWVKVYDLSLGKYDVQVTAGPAYATQKIEAASEMLDLIKAAPEFAPVIIDLIVGNMDWEGADVVAERLKKAVDPKLLSEAERNKMLEDQPKAKPPTPQEQAIMDLEKIKYEAEMKTAEAKIAESAAKEATAKADIAKAGLEMKEAQTQSVVLDKMAAGGDEMAQFIKEVVTQTIAEASTL